MYHPRSKNKELIARVLTYSLMTLSVVTIVTVSLLYTLGYRFDTTDRQVELSGLVQFVTTPPDAVVEIDGGQHSQTTPTKETVTSGVHEFVMWREGYETWRKSVTVEKGTLTWLNYARLVPKQRAVESVATLPTLAQTLASPDKRFMAAIADATKPTLTFYNLTADAVATTTLTMAAGDYSDASTVGVAHRFQIDQWDRAGRYLIVKHSYNDKIEWLVVDRQGDTPVTNVTRSFDVPVTKAYFADTGGTLLYALVDGTVRKINLRDQTISVPFVSDVSEFQVYRNVIGYVKNADPVTGMRQVGIIKDGEEPVVLYTTSSPAQNPVHIALSNYFHNDYVAVSDGTKVIMYNGAVPLKQSERSKLPQLGTFQFASDVAWLQMSPTGRFVIAQNAASYVSYDLERKELSPVATLAGTSDPRQIEWLDDYCVWSDRSDVLTMREFDGANQHDISAVVAGFDATVTQNGRWLYSIGRHSEGHLQLQRVRMILAN